MSNRKGFTLIEIILSIAILGIISIAFLTAISSHFSFLNKTKTITSNAFLAQREMEMEIDSIKEKIKNNDLILKDKIIFKKLGGINVNYYEVEKIYNNKPYYTLVSNIKPETFEPIELESVGIKLKQGITEVSNGYATGEFSVVGNFNNLEKYKWDHLLNIVEWYVSTDEYNMPLPKNPDFNLDDDIIYNSYYYPLFPRDYVLVSNETIYSFGYHERIFPKLKSYAGRHIVFTVTPGAKSGKIGKQMVSTPIFISGLPVTHDLVAHFDAGYINAYDSTEVEKEGEKNKVKKWIDFSSINGRAEPNEAAIIINSYEKPELKKTDMGIGFKGQYVRFSLNQCLRIENQSTYDKKTYIFAVVRNMINEESVFMKNGDQVFSIPSEIRRIDEGWVIVKDSFISKDDAFLLGGSNVDIAEIIIYDSELTTEEIGSIENYLNNKYKTPVTSGDIIELEDMEKVIKLGESFKLPSSVLAEMSRGYKKYVAVTWNGTFDINTVGTYQLTGRAITDSTKTMTYTLKVIDD